MEDVKVSSAAGQLRGPQARSWRLQGRSRLGMGKDHEFLPKKLQVPRKQQLERWSRQFDVKV